MWDNANEVTLDLLGHIYRKIYCESLDEQLQNYNIENQINAMYYFLIERENKIVG